MSIFTRRSRNHPSPDDLCHSGRQQQPPRHPPHRTPDGAAGQPQQKAHKMTGKLKNAQRFPKLGFDKCAETLRQHLGPYGFQVRKLDYDSLFEVAKMAFNVPGRSLVDVAFAVKGLGTRERSARVKEAVLKHWPTPTVLLPRDAPVRKWLAS